ncbi:MAG: single-stranded-DNA-specific exonuclease RecJ [Bacteroidia bacterium]|nr:single-stranded-DNA-specific exonuclease RecJ [Bacteroidia bacterium]
MPNQWKKTSEPDETTISKLAQKLGVTSFYAQLLFHRNILTADQASSFFSPDLVHLHDPFLFKDMEEAVNRIDQAVQADHKVWIYGDYDVDGTTSVAMFYSFLRTYVPNIDYYIPDREKEGYGLSEQAVELAIESGVNLIITLDCGIRSVDLVQKAKDKGIDFIICDHHEVGGEMPAAVAVLDAKRKDCEYPYKELSACGVGFKLIQALCRQWDLPDDRPFDYLDLVAVSIASDLVPITGENRILAYHGLLKLASSPSRGLRTIMDKFMNSSSVDITNIVFMIGPRINAAGRVSSANAAVKLLLADSDLDADHLAEELNAHNKRRRDLDKTITEQALHQLENDLVQSERRTTVLFDENWHKGIVGIVASRVLERHYKPTIILTQSGDKVVGSARSIEGFDIHNALQQCAPFLEQFGGHKFAAGMTLKPENLEAFRQAFEQTASELTPEDLTPRLYYEFEIGLGNVTEALYANLKRFAPFGPGNLKPLFVTRNVWDSGNLRTMGSDNDHLRLNLVSFDRSDAIGAVAFGFGDLYPKLRNGRKFDVLYSIEENHFRGNTTLQIMVKDIHLV